MHHNSALIVLLCTMFFFNLAISQSISRTLENMLVFLQKKLNFLEHKVLKIEQSEKRLIDMENKISAAKEFMIKSVENMRNEIIIIKQNVSERVNTLSISQQGMNLEVDELKQQIAESKVVIAELSDKLENMQGKINKMNEEPFLECGAWDRFGLSCYMFFDKEVEWEDAVANCKLEDAYLIEIDSSVENSYIVNLAKTRKLYVNETLTNYYYSDYYSFFESLTDEAGRNIGPWLGASDKHTEGNWMWEYSGRKVDNAFQGWNDGEPNGGMRENCLHLKEEVDYKWNDAPCDEKKPYACEKLVTVK